MSVRFPSDFENEYVRASVKPLGSITIRFVSMPTLIRMKRAAGRSQDMVDIEHLQMKLDDDGES